MPPSSDDWRSKAACKGLDSNMFVLDVGVSSAPAKHVCDTCSVRDPCDTYANGVGAVGVWGGKVHQNNRIAKQPKMGTIADMRPVAVKAPSARRRRTAATG